MGQKEDVMLEYYENPMHFADLMNGWLFGGKKRILPGNVSSVDRRYTGRTGKRNIYRPRQRDIVKKVANSRIRLIIGTELQTYIDYAMPVRIMDYDVAAYVEQVKEFQNRHKENNDLSEKEFLSGIRKTDWLLPVFTLVLYLGEDIWDGAVSLHEMLDFEKVPEEICPYVENYSIHVLDVMHTSDERLMEFPDDIACMFLIIKYQKDKSRLAELVEKLEMFHAVSGNMYETIWRFTGNDHLLKIEEQVRNEKGEVDMCQAIREMMEESEEKGLERGLERANKLILLLTGEKRYADLERAAKDKAYQNELFETYGI